MPRSLRLKGDEERARGHLSTALQLLHRLKLSGGGHQSLYHTWDLVDGTVVRIVVIEDLEIITITSPPSKEVPKEADEGENAFGIIFFSPCYLRVVYVPGEGCYFADVDTKVLEVAYAIAIRRDGSVRLAPTSFIPEVVQQDDLAANWVCTSNRLQTKHCIHVNGCGLPGGGTAANWGLWTQDMLGNVFHYGDWWKWRPSAVGDDTEGPNVDPVIVALPPPENGFASLGRHNFRYTYNKVNEQDVFAEVYKVAGIKGEFISAPSEHYMRYYMTSNIGDGNTVVYWDRSEPGEYAHSVTIYGAESNTVGGAIWTEFHSQFNVRPQSDFLQCSFDSWDGDQLCPRFWREKKTVEWSFNPLADTLGNPLFSDCYCNTFEWKIDLYMSHYWDTAWTANGHDHQSEFHFCGHTLFQGAEAENFDHYIVQWTTDTWIYDSHMTCNGVELWGACSRRDEAWEITDEFNDRLVAANHEDSETGCWVSGAYPHMSCAGHISVIGPCHGRGDAVECECRDDQCWCRSQDPITHLWSDWTPQRCGKTMFYDMPTMFGNCWNGNQLLCHQAGESEEFGLLPARLWNGYSIMEMQTYRKEGSEMGTCDGWDVRPVGDDPANDFIVFYDYHETTIDRTTMWARINSYLPAVDIQQTTTVVTRYMMAYRVAGGGVVKAEIAALVSETNTHKVLNLGKFLADPTHAPDDSYYDIDENTTTSGSSQSGCAAQISAAYIAYFYNKGEYGQAAKKHIGIIPVRVIAGKLQPGTRYEFIQDAVTDVTATLSSAQVDDEGAQQTVTPGAYEYKVLWRNAHTSTELSASRSVTVSNPSGPVMLKATRDERAHSYVWYRKNPGSEDFKFIAVSLSNEYADYPTGGGGVEAPDEARQFRGPIGQDFKNYSSYEAMLN